MNWFLFTLILGRVELFTKYNKPCSGSSITSDPDSKPILSWANLVEVGVEVRDGRHVILTIRVVAANNKVVVPCPWCIGKTRRWAWNGKRHVQRVGSLEGDRDGQHGVWRPALHVKGVVASLEVDRSRCASLDSTLPIVTIDSENSVDV